MPPLTNPTDIARETLKLLAARRVAPTPQNYQKIYHEIAGTSPDDQGGAALVGVLEGVFQECAKSSPEFAASTKSLQQNLRERKWKEFESGLAGLLKGKVSGGTVQPWSELIRDLFRQWELKQRGLTSARKKETLERVLINFGKDPAVLFDKLKSLVSNWAENPSSSTGVPVGELLPDESVESSETPALVERPGMPLPVETDADNSELQRVMRDMVSQALSMGIAPRLRNYPDLADEAKLMSDRAKLARNLSEINVLSRQLKQFWIKLELRAESDSELLDGLVRLLRLLIENISELMADDTWLHGQLSVIQDIISKPMDSGVINDAERSFKEVIFRQGTLKHSLSEAKATLKNMVTTFIERIGEMSESTGEYHKKIEGYSQAISQTEDMHQLNTILGDLMRDTRTMQLDMIRSHDDLLGARKQVENAEEKIKKLESELNQVSELVYQDHLTGTLNRRGMDDAFERELSRAERYKTPLTVAILDIDHFKKLNDTYGHDAGDEALVHLVNVVKDILRPTDVIARFGGEEFVIILPDTNTEAGVNIMARLQRELTKRFFLHQNERVLITFSAGVAQRQEGESADGVIARADGAMYKAKAAGRNRVMVA